MTMTQAIPKLALIGHGLTTRSIWKLQTLSCGFSWNENDVHPHNLWCQLASCFIPNLEMSTLRFSSFCRSSNIDLQSLHYNQHDIIDMGRVQPMLLLKIQERQSTRLLGILVNALAMKLMHLEATHVPGHNFSDARNLSPDSKAGHFWPFWGPSKDSDHLDPPKSRFPLKNGEPDVGTSLHWEVSESHGRSTCPEPSRPCSCPHLLDGECPRRASDLNTLPIFSPVGCPSK